MHRIKMVAMSIMVIVTAFVASFIAVNPAMAVKCPKGSIRGDDAEVDNLAQCNVDNKEAGHDNLMSTVQTIINVALAVLGLVTTVMIIIGGVTYATSNGDTAKIKRAKDTILYGVIGLVIALLAFAIVNFVLDNIFNGGGSTSTSDSSSAAGGN